MTILNTIIEHKQQEIARLKQERPIEDLIEAVKLKGDEVGAYQFEAVLRQPREQAHLICELKPKSPSAGTLQETPDVPKIISEYNTVASCISVLVDEHFFGGSVELLKQVKTLTNKPVLFKEFVIDLYQVLLAVEAGADAVLLIMKCLDDVQYVQLFEAIRSYGLTPVVEVQSEAELKRALLVNPPVILINNRNLETFAIDMSTTFDIATKLPKGTLCISASGFESLEDAQGIYPTAQAALIGTALMRQT